MEDYTAVKKGIATKFPDSTKAERKKFIDELDKEFFVDDQVLRTYVDDIIREDLRNSSYSGRTRAKIQIHLEQLGYNGGRSHFDL